MQMMHWNLICSTSRMGEKIVLTFTTLATKKKREKANGLLIRIYNVYFTLLFYVIWNLFLSFHSMPKIFYGNNYCHLDILLMFLRKCIEHQSFFRNFFMKHIEIISYFAILLQLQFTKSYFNAVLNMCSSVIFKGHLFAVNFVMSEWV